MNFEQISRDVDIFDATPEKLRICFEHFDADYYRSSNTDLSGDPIELFKHYMTAGWRQGRNPNASFRTVAYLLDHPELIATGRNPFLHHLFDDTPAASPTHDAQREVEQAEDREVKPSPPLRGRPRVAPLSQTVGQSLRTAKPISRDEALRGLSEGDLMRLRGAFDAEYYLRNGDLGSLTDPFMHYMTQGWLEGRDPSSDLSNDFYLDANKDIAAAGLNPFVHWVFHGKAEKRSALSFRKRIEKKEYRPKVSAIVPNYNHGKFLRERIDSILEQTYPNIDITILDDCSTDDSRAVIDDYCDRYPERIKKIYNAENSGGVFKQWHRGVDSTQGELVWICESDDFCEPDFIEKLVPSFRDDSVQIAFGRILETDLAGEPTFFLDTYREWAEAGIWEKPLVRPAADWFAHAFGVSNVIANVGGCVFRRTRLLDHVWQEAATYRVVGDWYLYIQVASGGQIAWEPNAVSYFRRHGANTSSNSFTGTRFYNELERLMMELRRTWDIPLVTVSKFYHNIVEQYAWFELEKTHGALESYCSLERILVAKRERRHILITMLGFVPGGGENFPIQLANSLVEAGWIVSMLVFETEEENAHMRASLNPAVSVFHSNWVTEYGCERFLRDAGVSLIHSHTIGAEVRFYEHWQLAAEMPYLVTLHGSYEASELPPEMWKKITKSINHFVYTADKNLLPLADQHFPPSMFTKMANAMPIDPVPFPKTREAMGIAEDAIVFTLVARGIKSKGWRAAIDAFRIVRARCPERKMHLCLVGEGEEPDIHRKKHGDDPNISFLGYQARIHGLYRITDVAVVPTRFVGESYPLCIIQALQVGTPVIGTDVGEISRMLGSETSVRGGIIVKAVRETDAFIAMFADAMEAVLDNDLRRELASGAQVLGQSYDMGPLVEVYGNLYSKIIDETATPFTALAA